MTTLRRHLHLWMHLRHNGLSIKHPRYPLRPPLSPTTQPQFLRSSRQGRDLMIHPLILGHTFQCQNLALETVPAVVVYLPSIWPRPHPHSPFRQRVFSKGRQIFLPYRPYPQRQKSQESLSPGKPLAAALAASLLPITCHHPHYRPHNNHLIIRRQLSYLKVSKTSWQVCQWTKDSWPSKTLHLATLLHPKHFLKGKIQLVKLSAVFCFPKDHISTISCLSIKI